MLTFLIKSLQICVLNLIYSKGGFTMYYIYKIENLINQKKYIGLTNNIQRRRARHFTDLKNGRHDNHFL